MRDLAVGSATRLHFLNSRFEFVAESYNMALRFVMLGILESGAGLHPEAAKQSTHA
jgi:hypothetical protein